MSKNAKSVVAPEVSRVVSAVIHLQAWKKPVGNWAYRFGNISKIESKVPDLSPTCQIWFDNKLWTQDNIFFFPLSIKYFKMISVAYQS